MDDGYYSRLVALFSQDHFLSSAAASPSQSQHHRCHSPALFRSNHFLLCLSFPNPSAAQGPLLSTGAALKTTFSHPPPPPPPNPNTTFSARRCSGEDTFLSPRSSIMAMSHMRSLRSIVITKQAVGMVDQRAFSAGAGKAKKGKGGAASDAPKTSSLSKEVKSTTVVGANILKDGTDPKVLPDSDYPDWLWRLIDKKPALSELRRKNTETLPYEDLKRFVKLDARARIKENNSIKAKN